MLSKKEYEEIHHLYEYNNFSSTQRNVAIKAIQKDFNNVFDIANIYWRGEFIDDMSRKDVLDYIHLAIESGDGEKIYTCAKHIDENKTYKGYVDELFDAIMQTNKVEPITCFAMLVKNINKKQFLALVEKSVNFKDAEAIVELANNSRGYRTCAEGFYIFDEFIDMVIKQKDDNLVRDILKIVKDKQDYTRGKPSYAIPLGRAVTTEQVAFAEELCKRYKSNNVEEKVYKDMDEEYYKE